MKIKASQIYSWDEEPVDERPSEFSSTTGHSVSSGYRSGHRSDYRSGYQSGDRPGPLSAFESATSPRRKRRSRSRLGYKTVLAFCVVLVALGAAALMKLAPMLRG